MNYIPIFLSSDNIYAPYLAACMASILDNTKAFCNFYILDGGIDNKNKEKIKNLKKIFNNFELEFIEINVEKFSDFPLTEGITHSTYSRFLIPNLKPELKKVIYIDCDTIALGDIEELYKEDLENYALGAVFNEKRRSFNLDTKEPMELSNNYKYFNAGVLVIDIEKWIKDNIIEKLFEIERKYRKKIPHGDESILNKYFDNNYKTLDIKYNYLEWDYSFNDKIEKIYIRHFITKIKPWMLNENNKISAYHNLSEFWHYAKMTDFYSDMIKNLKPDNIQQEMIKKIRLEKLLHQMNLKEISKLKMLKENVRG